MSSAAADCDSKTILGLKEDLRFSACVLNQRSDCVPAVETMNTKHALLVGGAAILAAEGVQGVINFDAQLYAGQAAFSKAMREGVLHETLLLKKGIVLPGMAEVAVEDTGSAAGRVLVQAVRWTDWPLLLIGFMTYTNNQDCSESVEGLYTTMRVEGEACRPVLTPSPEVFRFLELPESKQRSLLKTPAICRFYSDLAEKVRKAQQVGPLRRLECQGKQIAKIEYQDTAHASMISVTYDKLSTSRLRFESPDSKPIEYPLTQTESGTKVRAPADFTLMRRLLEWNAYRDVASTCCANPERAQCKSLIDKSAAADMTVAPDAAK